MAAIYIRISAVFYAISRSDNNIIAQLNQQSFRPLHIWSKPVSRKEAAVFPSEGRVIKIQIPPSPLEGDNCVCLRRGANIHWKKNVTPPSI